MARRTRKGKRTARRHRAAPPIPHQGIERIKRMLAEAGQEGKLHPIAFENGEPIGWMGDQTRDDCPCCLFLAEEEETPQPGTEPRLCRRCGQVIYLHPEDAARKKSVLCYRCFMGMKPRRPDPSLPH
ncbi:MAG: hypothetical protein HYY26_05625 [Acidobacteria bacterium]|nr:hypothetical protein [Acidobacteriota bacterium]